MSKINLYKTISDYDIKNFHTINIPEYDIKISNKQDYFYSDTLEKLSLKKLDNAVNKFKF